MSNKKIEIVGNRIKELREQNKFSQKDLAQAGKCTKQHISQIEKSDSVCISEEALFNLSTLLQCSPDYLRGIVDEPDMIRTGYKVSADESNAMSNKSCDTQKEYKTIRYASDPGNFRDLLIRKISTMPSNKWLILNMLLDCLKQCNDNEVKRFEEVCKIFFLIGHNMKILFCNVQIIYIQKFVTKYFLILNWMPIIMSLPFIVKK